MYDKRIMSEPTEVEARFGADGKITIRSLTWRWRTLPVVSHGRRWKADDGLHFLVMTTEERIFELVFDPDSGLWQVARVPDRRLGA